MATQRLGRHRKNARRSSRRMPVAARRAPPWSAPASEAPDAPPETKTETDKDREKDRGGGVLLLPSSHPDPNSTAVGTCRQTHAAVVLLPHQGTAPHTAARPTWTRLPRDGEEGRGPPLLLGRWASGQAGPRWASQQSWRGALQLDRDVQQSPICDDRVRTGWMLHACARARGRADGRADGRTDGRTGGRAVCVWGGALLPRWRAVAAIQINSYTKGWSKDKFTHLVPLTRQPRRAVAGPLVWCVMSRCLLEVVFKS
jgi:hypothetical protein